MSVAAPERRIFAMELRQEQDVVLARQRSREIGLVLGIATQDLVRLTTAVSEIARNAFRYATGGTVAYSVCEAKAMLWVRIQDLGPGITDLPLVLSGRYVSRSGMGLGITGSRKLLDGFAIESSPGGTAVSLGVVVDPKKARLDDAGIARLAAAAQSGGPGDAFAEVRRQNSELLFALEDARKSREALVVARELADAANLAKSRFLANMSHEIRTPLGAILGFAELLNDESTSSEDRLDFTRTILRNGHDLKQLIDDILDLSKVEAGMMALDLVPVSLSELVAQTQTSLGIKARDQGIALTLRLAPGVPDRISCDATRLRQVLWNVVGNALKFTKRGSVTAVIEDGGPGDDGDRRFVVSIADTGVGISVVDQRKLFEAFTQAESSTTRRFGGTGLGLALSKRLAAELGGDLVLQRSVPGEGSTFQFTFRALVLEQGEHVPEPRGRATPARDVLERRHRLEGVDILIVDDAIDNRLLVKRFLTREGGNVSMAANGAEGVEMATAGAFDVILMDVQMPVMDGFDATKELRLRGYSRPIIALSAHAMPEDRERFFAAGCSAYLTKPIDREQLIVEVQAAASLGVFARRRFKIDG